MIRHSLFALALILVLPACQSRTYHPLALANPGFEDAAAEKSGARWVTRQHAGPPSYEMTIDTSDAAEGKASFRIRRTLPQIFGAVGQNIPLSNAAGKSVRLRAKAKTQDVKDGQWSLVLSFLDSSSSILTQARSKSLEGTTAWQELEVEAVVPAGANRISVGASLGGDGSGWIDDVRVDLSE